MNKKIHLIFDCFYPDIGGVQVYMKEAHSRLIQNYNVLVHCLNSSSDKLRVLPAHELIDGIEVYRYNYFRYKFWPFSFKLSFFENSIISLQEFCILPHFIFYATTIILKIIGKKKYSLILSSHGLFSNDISKYPGISRKIKRIIDRSLGVILVNFSVDQIHVISEVEKKELLRAGINPSLIRDIFYGLDPDAYKNINVLRSDRALKLVEDNKPYILQVGRIDRHKNYESVIKSIPTLPQEIKYLIAGPFNSAEYKKELDNLIEELNLINRVKFIGSIFGIDKFYLMKNALVYTQLSYSEGFGMVVLEAKSQGTISIVNKNTGMEQIIKDNLNGFVVHHNETKSLVDKIKFIRENYNSKIIQNMKERNIQETRDVTWENTSRYLLSLFSQFSI